MPTLVRGFENWRQLVLAGLSVRGGRPFVVRLRPAGLRFRIRTLLDAWIIKEVCLDHEYERASVPLQDGWTIVDIGAGLGEFAIQAAANRPRTRVFAFEPAPDSFALLQANIDLNGATNVRAFALGVSGSAAHVRLAAPAREAARRRMVGGGSARGAIDLPATSLDAILHQLGVERCDFLKIDCEGGEYDILFNAHQATVARVRHVCLEYHEGVTRHGRHDLIQFFAERGFTVKLVPNPVHPETGLLYAGNQV